MLARRYGPVAEVTEFLNGFVCRKGKKETFAFLSYSSTSQKKEPAAKKQVGVLNVARRGLFGPSS